MIDVLHKRPLRPLRLALLDDVFALARIGAAREAPIAAPEAGVLSVAGHRRHRVRVGVRVRRVLVLDADGGGVTRAAREVREHLLLRGRPDGGSRVGRRRSAIGGRDRSDDAERVRLPRFVPRRVRQDLAAAAVDRRDVVAGHLGLQRDLIARRDRPRRGNADDDERLVVARRRDVERERATASVRRREVLAGGRGDLDRIAVFQRSAGEIMQSERFGGVRRHADGFERRARGGRRGEVLARVDRLERGPHRRHGRRAAVGRGAVGP